MSKKAIVIGAGIGGMAAALRLKHKGFDVDVFEKNDFPGGKLCSQELSGYRFDMGPSVFTLPNLVIELFELFGKKASDHFEYEALETVCNYFFEDGTNFTQYKDREKFADEIEQNTTATRKELFNYLEHIREIYDLTEEVFVFRSLHRFKNYLTKKVVKGLLNFGKIDAFKTVHEANSKYFKDQKMIQFFDRFATYNGCNPYQAPGTINVIQNLEINKGLYLPKGGMHAITTSVYKLCLDVGVRFHLSSKVEKINVGDKKASSVVANGKEYPCDIVMSDIDVHYLYNKLINDVPQPKKILDQPRSSSGIVFYWGIKKEFPELDVHNVLFTDDPKMEFESIFDREEVANDPTIYINITSKMEKNDAPEGGENWFTMINVPSNEGQDWDEIITRSRKNIIAKINRILKTDIEEFIEVEDVMHPQRLDDRYWAYKGSIYGNRFNSNFSAFFRHPNFTKQVKNLYFCGGTVHPGGGIPLALASAKIAVDSLKM